MGRNVKALPGRGKSMLQRGDKIVIKTTIGGGYDKDC
jgi:N-methylhydantoinase B/oxoprolinase/acetone carboxylase alpha subunit